MSIFLDTSFLIALNNAKDANYKSARTIKEKIKMREFGQCYISDYVFDELVTFLMAKSFPSEIIKNIGDSLLEEESISLLKIDNNVFLQSWSLFKKMKTLSFTDCTTILLAQQFNVKNIASFDTDFNKISLLQRVYQ